ncbi:MAG: hypothetical protein GY869_22950 [Planctomycetes bacterium]|nr:hypothetical protein [Planctomycetota bacterium]
MTKVLHEVVCQHQAEIEVWPSEAEVYFRDERHVDPLNTQVRFDAILYNTPGSGVHWAITDIDGLPGVGHIDQTGLYTAPNKGSLSHGQTVIVVASSADEPTRKAYARVTLAGVGPEPPPEPKLEIFPKQVYLYYENGDYNEYIDESNKMQLFRAIVRNSSSSAVKWKVGNNVVQQDGLWYLYEVSGGGAMKRITITAELTSGIKDVAKVIQINYK